MSFIKNAILQASGATGCAVSQLSDKESSALRACIEKTYASTAGRLPLWERLDGDASKYDPEGWKKIGEFPFEGRVTIFFDKDNEYTMFSANSFSDVVKLLAECPGFVFYVTDEHCSFLVSHNDHDYLIGAGAAKDWVERS